MTSHTLRRSRWPRILGAILFPLSVLVLAAAWLATAGTASTLRTGGVVAAQRTVLVVPDIAVTITVQAKSSPVAPGDIVSYTIE